MKLRFTDREHYTSPRYLVLLGPALLALLLYARADDDGCSFVEFTVHPMSPLRYDEASAHNLQEESAVTITCSAPSTEGAGGPFIYIYSSKESGTGIDEGISKESYNTLPSILHGKNAIWARAIEELPTNSTMPTLSFRLQQTTCEHQGTWKCRAEYINVTSTSYRECRREVTSRGLPKNLQIFLEPENVTLYVSDFLRVSCTGFIGSNDASWVFESRLPTDLEDVWPTHYDNFWATTPKTDSECRTVGGATLLVNVTPEDDGRLFRCFVKRPGQRFDTRAAESLPVAIVRDKLTKEPLTRPEPPRGCSMKAWIIFGVVVAGVLLIVFAIEVTYYIVVMWRRRLWRRSSSFLELPTPPCTRHKPSFPERFRRWSSRRWSSQVEMFTRIKSPGRDREVKLSPMKTC